MMSEPGVIKFYWLLLGILTVWRITHLLYAEDGPWRVVVRLRTKLGEGFFGTLLDCFHCLSVWVAAPVATLIGVNWREQCFLWPALSGAAILLERLTQRQSTIAIPHYTEDPEANHVLLRQSTTTIPPPAPDKRQP